MAFTLGITIRQRAVLMLILMRLGGSLSGGNPAVVIRSQIPEWFPLRNGENAADPRTSTAIYSWLKKMAEDGLLVLDINANARIIGISIGDVTSELYATMEWVKRSYPDFMNSNSVAKITEVRPVSEPVEFPRSLSVAPTNIERAAEMKREAEEKLAEAERLLAEPEPAQVNRGALAEALRAAINRHSAENGSNTPDYILAELVLGVLEAFDKAVVMRDNWYAAKAS